ncbi:MAG: hypothetical protein COB29_00925 [Sulfitobacter sp.]|nr:MAG: hypothetical protein COB29_00925 [Sulfitobacter sp.]
MIRAPVLVTRHSTTESSEIIAPFVHQTHADMVAAKAHFANAFANVDAAIRNKAAVDTLLLLDDDGITFSEAQRSIDKFRPVLTTSHGYRVVRFILDTGSGETIVEMDLIGDVDPSKAITIVGVHKGSASSAGVGNTFLGYKDKYGKLRFMGTTAQGMTTSIVQNVVSVHRLSKLGMRLVIDEVNDERYLKDRHGTKIPISVNSFGSYEIELMVSVTRPTQTSHVAATTTTLTIPPPLSQPHIDNEVVLHVPVAATSRCPTPPDDVNANIVISVPAKTIRTITWSQAHNTFGHKSDELLMRTMELTSGLTIDKSSPRVTNCPGWITVNAKREQRRHHHPPADLNPKRVTFAAVADWTSDPVVTFGINGYANRSNPNLRAGQMWFFDHMPLKSVGDLPPQCGGTKLLMIAVDFVSKYIMGKEMHSSAEDAITIREMISNMQLHKSSLPVMFLSDQEGSLKRAMETVCPEFGIAYHPLPPESPNTNLMENYMRILKEMTAKSIHTGNIHSRFTAKAVMANIHIHNSTAHVDKNKSYQIPALFFTSHLSNTHMRPPGSHGVMVKKQGERNSAMGDGSTLNRGIHIVLLTPTGNGREMEVYLPSTNRTRRTLHWTFPYDSITFAKPQQTLNIAPDSEINDDTTESHRRELHFDINHHDKVTPSPTRPPSPPTSNHTLPADEFHDSYESFNADSSGHIVDATTDTHSSNVDATVVIPDQSSTDGDISIDLNTDTTVVIPDLPYNDQVVADDGSDTDDDTAQVAATVSTAIRGFTADDVNTIESELDEPMHTTQVRNMAFSVAAAAKTKAKSFNLHDPKDLPWRRMLEDPAHTEHIRRANAREKDNLTDQKKLLKQIFKDDPEFAAAVKEAVTGRAIFCYKRDGTAKMRWIVRGDLITLVYNGVEIFTNLVKWPAIRLALFKTDVHTPGDRVQVVGDFAVAYIQSDKYPIDHPPQYYKIKEPESPDVWSYFRKYGYQYGERPAGNAWEKTYTKHLINDQGFTQGCNNRAVFCKPGDGNSIAMVYVDDFLADGEASAMKRIVENLKSRFDIKHVHTITDGTCHDLLGAYIIKDNNVLYLAMHNYIDECITALNLADIPTAATPIAAHITDLTDCSKEETAYFMTAVGMAQWCATVNRIDIKFALQRAAAYMKRPNMGALALIIRIWRYLNGTKYLTLASDRSVQEATWHFSTDSDNCSNPEVDNHRKPQTSYVAMYNNVPISFHCGAPKASFAHPKFDVPHADDSSTACEIYSMSSATKLSLSMSYLSEECGVPCPLPLTIYCDNTAAKTFADGTCKKSRLVHIDARQEWVRQLRDANICNPVYVNTKYNPSDLNTKIHGTTEFKRIRDNMMTMLPERLRDMTPT